MSGRSPVIGAGFAEGACVAAGEAAATGVVEGAGLAEGVDAGPSPPAIAGTAVATKAVAPVAVTRIFAKLFIG